LPASPEVEVVMYWDWYECTI